MEEELERDERRAAFVALLDDLEAADPTSDDVKRRTAQQADRIRAAAGA